jgi:signal transduction histidine kinase
MSLSTFIASNLEAILSEWEQFARTIGAAGDMRSVQLRDHAREILLHVAETMARPETASEAKDKSWGRSPVPLTETAAQLHGTGRESEGFTLNDMVSEYRALRAAVIRLWQTDGRSPDARSLGELTRFNEELDEALSESVARFEDRLDRSRQMILAILGHDLRNPLGAIKASILLLGHRPVSLDERQTAALRIAERSAERLEQMVGDLLDAARTRLGRSLPISRSQIDLRNVAHDVVEELRVSHPARSITVRTEGPLTGFWDSDRLAQLFSNLVGNAIENGDPTTEIALRAHGDDAHVIVDVHNFGAPIPDSVRLGLFEPLTRLRTDGPRKATDSLGLGLYIACQIVKAHGGNLSVESEQIAGTTFRVRLPRRAPTS